MIKRGNEISALLTFRPRGRHKGSAEGSRRRGVLRRSKLVKLGRDSNLPLYVLETDVQTLLEQTKIIHVSDKSSKTSVNLSKSLTQSKSIADKMER